MLNKNDCINKWLVEYKNKTIQQVYDESKSILLKDIANKKVMITKSDEVTLNKTEGIDHLILDLSVNRFLFCFALILNTLDRTYLVDDVINYKKKHIIKDYYDLIEKIILDSLVIYSYVYFNDHF